MKRSKKITLGIITFFVVIAVIVIGRYSAGLYFKKKFSKRPPPGVRTGSIEGSMCLPYSECINPKDNSFLNKKILNEKFKSLGVIDNSTVFSCGSSVTASVLGVAYSLINNKYMPIIYVGSWSEYGKK